MSRNSRETVPRPAPRPCLVTPNVFTGERVTTAVLAPRSAPPSSMCPPEMVWKRLARLAAAPGRSRMRVWNPQTEKFSDTAKRTDRLPTRPAAVYLYSHGRTQLLWLDFDAKRYGAAAVDADMATAPPGSPSAAGWPSPTDPPVAADI